MIIMEEATAVGYNGREPKGDFREVSVMPDKNANPVTTPDPKEAVKEWYGRLSQNCAAVDYDSTMPMVADDVLSFGTKADIVSGRDYLRKNQWEGIWPNIRGFKVNMDSIHSGGNGDFAWGIATWTSTGFHEDGTSYHRPGRATTLLERRNGEWLVVHTHFSLNPGTPPRTFGAK
jgi:ketosteroid isomerase-like protein